MPEIDHKNYFTKEQLPFMWCAGCGNGIIVNTLAKALHELAVPPDQTVIVTGIGCFGKADDYFKTHGFHGTHGRALAYASGIAAVKPRLKVIVLMGDGDATTIGGNHFIHTARRNMDLTVVIANNFNYGMTGGQYSATTPLTWVTSTSPLGTAEPSFDVCQLAEAAGANFTARTTVYHTVMLKKLLTQALEKKGFSMVEVFTPCPTYFGRYNKMNTPVKMMNWLKEIGVPKNSYNKMDDKSRKDFFPIGVLSEASRPDFLEQYQQLNHMGRGENNE